MMKTGDCVVKHGGTFTTGLGMVVSWVLLLGSVHDGICVLRKAHMHYTPDLRSFPSLGA